MPAWQLSAPIRVRGITGAVAVAGDIAHASALTSATLAGPSNAPVATDLTYTVTLNADANQTFRIQLTCPGATVTPSSYDITAGNRVATFTVRGPSPGSYAVDFDIIVGPALARVGRPISLTLTSELSDLPANTITTGSTASTGVTYGQPFKQGAVGAGASLSGRQLNALTYWPDGSVKHAIVSRIVSGATSYSETLTIGTAASGSALTTANLPSGIRTTGVTITAGAFGSVSWTGADWDSPFQWSTDAAVVARNYAWFSGPVCSSWIYRKPFPSDSHLTAWLEVRLWSNGQVEVFPWIENGYLTVATPTNKDATYTFSMGGTTRFSQAIDIKHHTRVPLVNTSTSQGSATSFSHWLGTDPQARCVHDGAYVAATKLVPYLGWGSSSVATLDALTQNYTPNTLAGDDNATGTAGGAGNAIAPTQCHYLISNGDIRAWKAMMAHALSSGSWSHHYRDESTNRPLRPSSWPNIRIGYQDPTQSIPPMPVNSGGEVPGTGAYGGPAISHLPSYSYVPLLLTGRYWMLDELLFWATYCIASFHRVNRGGALGIMQYGQPRYRAWALNSLAQAAALTPTVHPIQPDLIASWQANTDRHRKQFVDGTYTAEGNWVSPQGYLGDYTGTGDGSAAYSPYFERTGNGVTTSFETYGTRDISTYTVTVNGVVKSYGTDWTVVGTSIVFAVAPPNGAQIFISTNANQWWTAPWQHHYMTVVFGLASDLGIPQSAQSLADHLAVRNHAYKQQIQAAEDGLGGRFNWRFFSRYEYPLGADRFNLPLDSYYTIEQSAAIYRAELGLPDPDPTFGGTLLNRSGIAIADGTSSRAYLAPAAAALALAVEHGVAGASEGYERVTNASNYVAALTNYLLGEAPQWGIKPRIPSWVPATNTVATLAPSLNTGIGRPVAFWRAGGGVAVAHWRGRYGRILTEGGGHGDGAENDIWELDIDGRTWSQIKPYAPIYAKANTRVADPVTGWMWANAIEGDTTVQVGEAHAIHSGQLNVAVHEKFLPGLGATGGWFFSVGRTAMPYDGQSGAYHVLFKLRLDVDQKWTHHSALDVPLTEGYWWPFDSSCLDPKRRRLWYHLKLNPSVGNAPSTRLGYRDLATQVVGSQNFTGITEYNGGGNEAQFYMRRYDCVLSVGAGGGVSYTDNSTLGIVVWDLTTGLAYRPTITGTGPTMNETLAKGWSDPLNKLMLVAHSTPNRLWFLTPSGDPRSGATTWAWSYRDLGGQTMPFLPAGAIANGLMRLVPVINLPNVLVYLGAETQPVQVINMTPP